MILTLTFHQLPRSKSRSLFGLSQKIGGSEALVILLFQ